MKVRGTTVEARKKSRQERTAERRAVFYRRVIRGASSPAEQLRLACDYVRAIGDDLPVGQVTELARALTEIADRWNQQ